MVDLANMETVEKECGALGGLFQAIVNDMKVEEMTPPPPPSHLCSLFCTCALWDAHPRRHGAGGLEVDECRTSRFLRRNLI